MMAQRGRLGALGLTLACSAWFVVAACSDDAKTDTATAPDAAPDAAVEANDGGDNRCATAPKPTHTCTVAQCTQQNGGAPAACVDDKCVPLATAECTGVYGATTSDDTILIGSLLSTRGTDSLNGVARERSVALAVKEINAAGGLYTGDGCGRRQLVYVGCDDSNSPLPPDAGADGGTYDRLVAAKHLVNDLKVVGIVGGMNTNNTLAAMPVTFPAKTALFPPSAGADLLTTQAGGVVDGSPLLWRLTPADAFQTKAIAAVGAQVATLVNKPTSTKVAILYRDDAFGNGGFQSLQKLLTVNGKPYTDPANAAFVLDRKHPTTGVPSSVVDDIYAFQPDIIFVFSLGEFSGGFLAPYEDKTAAAGIKPQYVVSKSTQRQDVLNVIKTHPDVKKRFRGTSDFIVTPLMQDFFNFRFKQAYPDQTALLAAMPNAYDGAYLIAYAAQASKPTWDRVDPFQVVKSIPMLVGGTAPIDVGPTKLKEALETLRAGGKIDFNGTSGAFDYDTATGDMPGDFATWCVKSDPNTQDPVYENITGQVWRHATNTLDGAFNCPE